MTRTARWLCAVGIGLALAASGCVTAATVKKIVDDANRETIASLEASALEASVPPLGTDPDATPEWELTLARMEEYIATHPDQPRTTTALRIRQAALLLAHQQPNRALGAFEQVDGTQLSNERDRALYQARHALVWWYGLRAGGGGAIALDAAQREEAKTHMDELAEAADPLADKSTTRRLLEQIRVRIANLRARAFSSPDSVRDAVEPAITRYADRFAAEELPRIRCWHGEGPCEGARPELAQTRWYDYYPCAFVFAEQAWKAARVPEPFERKPEWVTEAIADECQQ
jgi:hypothetical protein